MRPAFLAMLLVVGACAQLQTRAPEDLEFNLSGRLAARYGKDAFTGNLAWQHGKSADELLISSSLGAGVARIVRTREGVVLTTAQPKEYRASDPETLTEEVLGFRLPLGGLADWVRGRPSAGAPSESERDANGRLAKLRQRGWDIEYLEYRGDLPSRLRLTYPGIELRLAITEWK